MSERLHALTAWLRGQLALPEFDLEPASADASFRRYFRVRLGDRSWIAMDAPPEREDCRPFVRVAAMLRDAGLNAPEVLAMDLARGFLLLTDLGTRTYLDVLDERNADDLYGDAIDALVRWQRASRPDMLPPYDRALLRRELELFPEWYLARHLGVELSRAERATLDGIFTLLEDSALAQPQVYVHRDYMPRNLMVSDPNPGVLDFQDAVFGPVTYDILSLLKDAFLSWDEARVVAWLARYRAAARAAGIPLPAEEADFRRAFDWMGMQRHLKVLGIFARLCYRDGKRGYLEDTPRFLRYVRETGTRYREFTPLLRLLDACEVRAAAVERAP
ncbi:MAG TPA: phosphotransferase [Gammaproteobacteria bacterium]|nr:phosphotransferase [Gammaproteobacteria bacterium]